jgi:hypothetical protein
MNLFLILTKTARATLDLVGAGKDEMALVHLRMEVMGGRCQIHTCKENTHGNGLTKRSLQLESWSISIPGVCSTSLPNENYK